MANTDYIFKFHDITNTGCDVKMISHDPNANRLVQIYINDEGFSKRRATVFPEILADFVDIAISVYLADWLSVRRKDKVYTITVELPLRQPDVFNKHQSLELLNSVLYWFTGDHWNFEFLQRKKRGRKSELQYKIPDSSQTEVALWSGGLDSFAGLFNRMNNTKKKNFTLFGSGPNKHANGVQQRLANKIWSDFNSRVKLIQMPFYINLAKKIRKNQKLRSRGFSFLVLGAACACLENQNTLFVYENGMGAINLPYRASEVGLDHSRSVHPLSLVKTSELISNWLGTEFIFENPFLFNTKAEICRIFNTGNYADLISKTISCDSRFRQKRYHSQCGFCSSCILRRQSLLAAGIPDKTKYVITDNRAPKLSESLHYRAMKFQIEAFRYILESDKPWYQLTKRYSDLQDIADQLEQIKRHTNVPKKLITLYSHYVKEWDKVGSIIGKGLDGDD